MVIKLKKIKKDNNASGFGTLLIIFPFVITVILSIIFIPLGESTQIGGVMVKPDNYDTMTKIEREAFLWNSNGANQKSEIQYIWRWRLSLDFPDFAGTWVYVFPNGYEVEKDEYDSFIDGSYSMGNPVKIAQSVLTLNPPILDTLGIVGVMIRICMIVSVGIGLTEILWIGG